MAIRRRTTGLTVGALIALLISTATLWAQQTGVEAVTEWLAQSRAHGVYRTVEPQLVELFRSADSLSVPPALLLSRLNLGAARRLPPGVLLRGMKEELARLTTASLMLSRVEESVGGRRFVASSSRSELLNAISIYLSGGLSRELLSEVLTESARSDRSAEDAFQACAALLAVDRVGHLSDRELLSLGTSLMGSRLSPTSYSAVGSFIARAIATGRGGKGILAAVEQILDQGGGLPQMELELGRRR